MIIHSHRSLRIAIAMLAATAMVMLNGCSLTGTAPESAAANTSTISGRVRGGQQPIYNGTVNLYAAGTTGYGSAGTLLATTTTDLSGAFQFTPSTANPGPGITSTWTCPTTTPASDSQIYLILTRGNSSGSGLTTPNTAIGLLAALGPCSQISPLTYVEMNELTTAATVYALAQYINPGSGAGNESIGTNGVNYTATGTTPQGAVGLNNAVAGIVNLATLSTGAAVTSNTYTGTATNVSGVTVTATPNSAKLITVANTLASCINQTSSTANNCVDLFNNAVPPPVATVTSQPLATFAAAADTIQAAYYLAVNPTNNSSTAFSAGSCNTTPAATSRGACLFGLSTSNAPFQSGVSSTPNDWTIGVTYSSTSSCPIPYSALFLSGPYASAVDVNGNLWFINAAAPVGTAASATFGEISPTGQPLFCGGGASSSGFTGGRGITIDPAGNVWPSFSNQAKIEMVAAGATTQASCLTPGKPYGIVSDGNGNIFYSPGTSTNAAYVLPYGSASSCNATTSTEWISTGYIPANTSGTPYIVADGLGRIWFQQEGNASQAQIAYPVSASITGYSVSSGTITFTATNTFLVGQTVTVAGLTSAEGLTLDHQNYIVTAANSSSFSAASLAATIGTTPDTGTAFISVPSSSTTYTADTAFSTTTNTYGLAIDNNNFGYVGSTCCSTTTDEEFYRISAGATSTVAPTKITSGSGTYFAGSAGSRSLAIDGAGNIWFGMVYPEVGTITDPATTDIYGIGEFYMSGTTFNALSPSGSTPGTCSSSSAPPQCPVGGGFQDPNLLSAYGISLDPSGNVWVPNTGGQVALTPGASTSTYYYYGTSITELVGAAVPVVTPTSLGLKNGTQGMKP